MSTAPTPGPGAYTHTLRITFVHDGPKLEIKRVERVAMRSPGSLSPPAGNKAGYWLEIRDRNGTLIYHRPIHDPMRRDIESFGEAPGAPMRRHPSAATQGEFDVLVPDLPDAATFRLHGPPSADPRMALAPGGALSVHSFDDLHDRARRDAEGGVR